MCGFDEFYNLNNYLESFKKITKISRWKNATRAFEKDFLLNSVELKNSIIEGTYFPVKPILFKYNERGKIRMIENYDITDKIVMDILCTKILLPIIKPKLIYDNAASLKNRGTSFFNRRFKYHLHDFLIKHKVDNGQISPGYILLGDFKKYFDNINHECFINQLKSFGINDERILDLIKKFLLIRSVCLEGLSEEEINSLVNEPFDSVKFYTQHTERVEMFQEHQMLFKTRTPEKEIWSPGYTNYLKKSMGIGGQLAQIAGIIAAHKVDTYCKNVRGFKYYGRYMDDFYIICDDKETLKQALIDIKTIVSQQKLFLNENKTQIVNLKHKFTLLKIQYQIKNTKIERIPCKESFHREQRKLKKFKNKFERNELSFDVIYTSFKSWEGNILSQFRDVRSLQNTRNLFDELFIKEWLYNE